MLVNWFNANAAKEFGVNLAEFYLVRVTVEGEDKSAKFVEKKHKNLLAKMTLQINQFKAQNKLNIYKKAQLGNVFKWRLLEAGFDRDYVNQITNWLMRNF